jgi:serine protease Do
MRRFTSVLPALLVLLVTGLTLWAGPSLVQSMQLARVASVMTVAETRLDSGESAAALDALQQGTRAIADAVLPGVVHIDVTVSPTEEQVETMEELRKRFGGRSPLPPGHPGIPSTGSGWVYDAAGHVITNAHVVRDATDIRVEMNDGRVFDAQVVARDDATDVAVIAIDPSKQGGGPVFPLRRASKQPVYVGDRVFVFGSPFGFKFSMSQGIVSALGRSEAASWVGMMGGYTNYIQTDAAMNPGNSGGPIVNTRGMVIGMNTAIANSRTESGGGTAGQGQNAGLGFAIPVDTVDVIVEQLISGNVVIRGFLGVILDELPPEYAAERGYVGRGVLIGTRPRYDPRSPEGKAEAGRNVIDPASPAGKAGIKRGDIITSVDGMKVAQSDVLRSLISVRRPGQTVTLGVWRDGKAIEITAKLGAAYTRREGPGFFRPIPIPGGDEMTMDQLRAWVKGEAEKKPEPEPPSE